MASNLLHYDFFSQMLKKDMAYSVYLPPMYEDEDRRFPVLYLLHGRSGDENFLAVLDLPVVSDKMITSGAIAPMIIVCPRMDNTRGLNTSNSCSCVNGIDMGRYEDYLILEVIPKIDQEFRTIPNKEFRFIGGASSGGFAAVHYGLHYPDLFSKVGGHMAAIEGLLDKEDLPYYGDETSFHNNNPFEFSSFTSEHCKQTWYLDAGNCDEGGFDKTTELFANYLTAKGMTVEHHIYSGHHNLQYIKNNIEKYLLFYGAQK